MKQTHLMMYCNSPSSIHTVDISSQSRDSNFINWPDVTARLCFLLLRQAGRGEQDLDEPLEPGKLSPYQIRKCHLDLVLYESRQWGTGNTVWPAGCSQHPLRSMYHMESTAQKWRCRQNQVAEREQGKPEASCALPTSQPFLTFSLVSFLAGTSHA